MMMHQSEQQSNRKRVHFESKKVDNELFDSQPLFDAPVMDFSKNQGQNEQLGVDWGDLTNVIFKRGTSQNQSFWNNLHPDDSKAHNHNFPMMYKKVTRQFLEQKRQERKLSLNQDKKLTGNHLVEANTNS